MEMPGCDLPSGCLSSSLVRLRLSGFLAQSRGTIATLFSHCLSIWKVLRSVDYHDQSSNLGSIDGHVGEDARRVRAISGGSLGCHVGLFWALLNEGD